MRLPAVKQGGTQSLGRHSVGSLSKLASAEARLATANTKVTDVIVGGVTKAIGQVIEKVDKYEQSKADMHVIDAMATLEEDYAGKDVVPADDPGIQKYNFDRKDAVGNIRTEIPVHEFYSQMYEDVSRKAVGEAGNYLTLPSSKEEWAMKMDALHTRNIAKMHARMEQQQERYMEREQKLMIDAAIMRGHYQTAYHVLDNFTGTPGDRAVIEARIGKAQVREHGKRVRDSRRVSDMENHINTDKSDVMSEKEEKEENEETIEARKDEIGDAVDEQLETKSFDEVEEDIGAADASVARTVGGGVYTAKSGIVGALLDDFAVNAEHAEELEEKYDSVEEMFSEATAKQKVMLGAGLMMFTKAKITKAVSASKSLDVNEWLREMSKKDQKKYTEWIGNTKEPDPKYEEKSKVAMDHLNNRRKEQELKESPTGTAVSKVAARRYAELADMAFGTQAEKEEYMGMDFSKMFGELTVMQIDDLTARQERMNSVPGSVDAEGDAMDAATEGMGEDKKAEVIEAASKEVNLATQEKGTVLNADESRKAVGEGAKSVARKGDGLKYGPTRKRFADIPKGAIDEISKRYKEKYGEDPTAQTVEKWYENNREYFKDSNL